MHQLDHAAWQARASARTRSRQAQLSTGPHAAPGSAAARPIAPVCLASGAPAPPVSTRPAPGQASSCDHGPMRERLAGAQRGPFAKQRKLCRANPFCTATHRTDCPQTAGQAQQRLLPPAHAAPPAAGRLQAGGGRVCAARGAARDPLG